MEQQRICVKCLCGYERKINQVSLMCGDCRENMFRNYYGRKADQLVRPADIKKYLMSKKVNTPEDFACAICLDDAPDVAEWLCCKHKFHVNCICELHVVNADEQYVKCPLCRQTAKNLHLAIPSEQKSQDSFSYTDVLFSEIDDGVVLLEEKKDNPFDYQAYVKERLEKSEQLKKKMTHVVEQRESIDVEELLWGEHYINQNE